MSASPMLPLMSDGTLPPVAFLLHWLASRRAAVIQLDRLPAGNGALPDLLSQAGVTTLLLTRNPVGRPFRWEGWNGGRVLVDATTPVDDLPLHHGELPWSATDGGIDPAVAGLIDLARLEDANAASSGVAAGHGAAWEHLLAICEPRDNGQAPRVPPIASHGAALGDGRLGAWNPLPFARRAVVALPVPRGTPPWGLVDQRGVRHPVQVVEGPLGRELLTSVTLGALEAVSFSALFDPVPAAHWEVNRTVLDNGRVRAELDPLGQVVRLCCDGRFVDWSGPALQPLIDGMPFSGQATTTVLEDGPIRGRVVVTRISERGTLNLTYTLHAHEDVLRVAATWDGDADLQVICPTVLRGAPLEAAGELASWMQPQRALAGQPAMTPLAGLRWARLRDSTGHGLAVIGLRPLTLAAQNGRLSIHVERTASFALVESGIPARSGAMGRLALGLAVPARAAAAAIPAVLRMGDDGVVPWWISRPAEWRGEVLLGHQHDHHIRCTFQVAGATEMARRELNGSLRPLPVAADGDGIELDLGPGELAWIRWR
jgi:hypothetical protein